MEESLLETSSEETQVEALQKYNAELLEMLRWNIGILSVMLQEAGGTIEITKDVLESIDVAKAQTIVTFNNDRDVYVIEGVFEDGV